MRLAVGVAAGEGEEARPLGGPDRGDVDAAIEGEAGDDEGPRGANDAVAVERSAALDGDATSTRSSLGRSDGQGGATTTGSAGRPAGLASEDGREKD